MMHRQGNRSPDAAIESPAGGPAGDPRILSQPASITALEYGVAFLAGFLVLARCLGGLWHDAGLPGNDSFYHLKMAKLLPEVGLLRTFPWLQYAYFMQEGDGFVSHHYGFHTILLAFVKAAEAAGMDDMAGARIAMATCMGTTFVLVLAIFRTLAVPYRGFWLILMMLLPYHFYVRHAYVRAIGPSLVMMLLICWLLLKNRPILTGLALAAFTHVYLGGVIYGPLVVATFVASRVLTLQEPRGVPWRMLFVTVGGWILGILTFPYRRGMVEFLSLQLFGTGLSPDIKVGREWRSYEGLWWFSSGFAGTLLLAISISVMLRLRSGKRLEGPAFMLLLLNGLFMVLTLKARRFVEYWPVFGLLSAATLTAPVFTGWHIAWRDQLRLRIQRSWKWGPSLLLGAGVIACLALAFVFRRRLLPINESFMLLLAAPAVLFFIAGMRGSRNRPTWETYVPIAGLTLWLAVPFSAAATATIKRAQNSLQCKYDLAAVSAVMEAAKRESKAGDIIFTDDWDIFPVFFYYNSHNHFIVGLDPKFTHARRPDLWERFVRITQGNVPSSATVEMPEEGGSETKIDVRITDIQDMFGAALVVTDKEHGKMSRRLARNESLFAPCEIPLQQDGDEKVYRLWRVVATNQGRVETVDDPGMSR